MRRSRPARLVVVLVAAAVAVAAVVVIVKNSDGEFSGQYALSGSFAKAGEGLHPGSEVTYRGVQVGQVSTISLAQRKAVVDMTIDPTFRVPSDATATIEPINVFGADVVNVTFPTPDRAPALAAGSTIGHTVVSSEIEDLFAAADPLLAQIDAPDLTTIVSNLAQASLNEGPTIAQSIDEGAKLASLLDQTLPAQLSALDSFNGFSAALAPTANSLNALAVAANQALPAFNQAAPAYKHLLATLAPFADDLAELLSAYHPDIETLLDDGDNVARVLLVNQQQIGTLIQGLGVYFQRFADAVSPDEVLPDGSHFGYFQTFIFFGDINQLVCSLLAPAVPGLSFLEPLQQALSGAGTPLNCSSELSAFDAAQTTSAASSSSPSNASAQQAGQQLSTQAYNALSTPEVPSSGGVGGIIDSLLGGHSGRL